MEHPALLAESVLLPLERCCFCAVESRAKEYREQAQEHNDEPKEENVGDGRREAHTHGMNKLLEEYSSLRTKGRKAMLNGCHSLWRKQYLWVLKLGKTTGRHQPFQRLRQIVLKLGLEIVGHDRAHYRHTNGRTD